MQQMNNIDREQRALTLLVTETYDSLNRINLIDEPIVDHLNL